MFVTDRRFQATSIFEVCEGSKGKKKLARLCDINSAGVFEPFKENTNLPRVYENHAVFDLPNNFYNLWNNGPARVQSIEYQIFCAWWEAKTIVEYQTRESVKFLKIFREPPIEVVTLSSAKNHKDIVTLLREEGTQVQNPCCRVLFVAADNTGLLFKAHDLSKLDENHVFLENLPFMPFLIKNISEDQFVKCVNTYTKKEYLFFGIFTPIGVRYLIKQNLDNNIPEKRLTLLGLVEKKRQGLKTKEQDKSQILQYEEIRKSDKTPDDSLNESTQNINQNSLETTPNEQVERVSETYENHTTEFFMKNQTTQNSSEHETITNLLSYLKSIVGSKQQASDLFKPGTTPNLPKITHEGFIEVCKSFCDVFESILENLDRSSYLDTVGRFFYMVYLRRLSMLLAGPDGMQIAESFSLIMTGKTPDILSCSGDYNSEILDRAFADTDRILVVTNPFDGAWFEHIILKIAQGTKTVLLLSPFVGDLRIEPEGLFDYVVPIATDALIKAFPSKTTERIVGVRAHNYEECEFIDEMMDDNFEKISQNLNIRRRLKGVTSSLFANVFRKLELEEHFLYYCVLSLYPYAVMTGQRNVFDNIVQEHNEKLSNKAKLFFKQL